jgi:hypothetical protein
MFSEVNRALETLCESFTVPELSNSRKRLEKVKRRIENWVRGLESTISLSSSYLSLDESKRAMAHSVGMVQLTIIAFVFIPLFAVASGFRMNVNVLKNNPQIYWFVGIGTGVTLLTSLIAVFFQEINSIMAYIDYQFLTLTLDLVFLTFKILVLPFWSAVLLPGSRSMAMWFFEVENPPMHFWKECHFYMMNILW